MKPLLLAGILALSTTVASAQDAPKFFADTYPEHALDEAMTWYGKLNGEGSALDAKTTELVMLGVAAQIPCNYCVHAHSAGAKAAGATEEEIRTAVAAAAAVRMWSTVLNGMDYDYDAFVAELDGMYDTPGN
jgi:AhpD family alkylhydroperoxidase